MTLADRIREIAAEQAKYGYLNATEKRRWTAYQVAEQRRGVLSEIARAEGVTRQAVFDTIRRAMIKLRRHGVIGNEYTMTDRKWS